MLLEPSGWWLASLQIADSSRAHSAGAMVTHCNARRKHLLELTRAPIQSQLASWEGTVPCHDAQTHTCLAPRHSLQPTTCKGEGMHVHLHVSCTSRRSQPPSMPCMGSCVCRSGSTPCLHVRTGMAANLALDPVSVGSPDLHVGVHLGHPARRCVHTHAGAPLCCAADLCASAWILLDSRTALTVVTKVAHSAGTCACP